MARSIAADLAIVIPILLTTVITHTGSAIRSAGGMREATDDVRIVGETFGAGRPSTLPASNRCCQVRRTQPIAPGGTFDTFLTELLRGAPPHWQRCHRGRIDRRASELNTVRCLWRAPCVLTYLRACLTTCLHRDIIAQHRLPGCIRTHRPLAVDATDRPSEKTRGASFGSAGLVEELRGLRTSCRPVGSQPGKVGSTSRCRCSFHVVTGKTFGKEHFGARLLGLIRRPGRSAGRRVGRRPSIVLVPPRSAYTPRFAPLLDSLADNIALGPPGLPRGLRQAVHCRAARISSGWNGPRNHVWPGSQVYGGQVQRSLPPGACHRSRADGFDDSARP